AYPLASRSTSLSAPPPTPTLLPYTTLFRSSRPGRSSARSPARHAASSTSGRAEAANSGTTPTFRPGLQAALRPPGCCAGLPAGLFGGCRQQGMMRAGLTTREQGMPVQPGPARIAGIGMDLLRLERVQRVFDRHPQRFVLRILGPAEIQTFERRYQRDPRRGVRYLATRFAAKEAFSKAIGLGMRMPMAWSR